MSKRTKTIEVPLNRVEGDLEVRVELDDGAVSDAWSAGVMFRGFEQILVGRGPLDGLVITPRICGICTTAHLSAAAGALNAITAASPPPDAVRISNIAQLTEYIQSDVRQAFLMFAVDFAHPVYRGRTDLYEEALRRYEPLRGETAREVLRETRKVLEIITIFGGQWPHSSYMVPGGVVSLPSAPDVTQSRLLLQGYRRWYERRVLGCALERWAEVRSAADLDAWLEEKDAHRHSDLGFFIRFARDVGLDRIGRSHDSFVCYGALEAPENGGERLIPAGFARGTEPEPFDQRKIAEHVACSWFVDYEGGKHPSEGVTEPYASGREGKKYSWAKAVRYDEQPAEAGPLSEMIARRSPLFCDIVGAGGASAFSRELARIVRPAALMPMMERQLGVTSCEGELYRSPGKIDGGEGIGLVEASRGALGHWVRIEGGKIAHYQIITPTAWNASPRDSAGTRGPMEQALVGTEVRDPENPIELGHVVRSFDPCLVCTVH